MDISSPKHSVFSRWSYFKDCTNKYAVLSRYPSLFEDGIRNITISSYIRLKLLLNKLAYLSPVLVNMFREPA